MLCPTVKIQSDNEDGYVVINESDFDSSKHTLWTSEDPEAKRLAEEAQLQAEEAKRLADETEAKRLADEAKRLADEAETKRLADEAKRLAEEAKRPVLTAQKKAK